MYARKDRSQEVENEKASTVPHDKPTLIFQALSERRVQYLKGQRLEAVRMQIKGRDREGIQSLALPRNSFIAGIIIYHFLG